MITKDLYNARGQATASIVDGLLRKTIGAQHLLARPPALAFDADHIEEAAAAGVTKVLVRNRDTGAVYRVSFETFRAKSFEIDRGFGRQRALALRHWQIEGGEPSPSTLIGTTPATTKMGDPGQLSLFLAGI
jgi:hypothetical protein